jgi:hypothetical protein
MTHRTIHSAQQKRTIVLFEATVERNRASGFRPRPTPLNIFEEQQHVS